MNPRLCESLIRLAGAAILSTPLLAWGEEKRALERPNILFIYADDHSPKTLSCYEGAYPMARTPHIDALAASGIRFQGAYLGSWCMPSRASLLTGHHPHAIESMRMEGRYPGSVYDPEQCKFWPAVFRRHGYQTAQIGKWHTGMDAGFGRDWDYQIVWNRPKNPANAGQYYGPQITEFNGAERTVEGYSTDNYTRWACDYIRGEGRDPGKPWYLWLCYGAVHGPTTPATRHQGACAGLTAPPPDSIFPPRERKPNYLERTQAWDKGPQGEPILKRGGQSYNQWLRQVNECMLAVDEGVGQVLQALKETGQLEKTLVIYSSDQGFANGEHGMRQKVAPYEATYRSPLIMSRPGSLPQGQYCPHPVNAPDLVVTFFAQAGVDLPWKMHGRDLSPLLKNPADPEWNHPVLYQHTGQDYGSDVIKAVRNKAEAVHSGVPYFAAVRQGTFKYIHYLAENEIEELYDLKSDPEERDNLARDPQFRSIRDRLRFTLITELERCDAAALAGEIPR